MLKLQKATKIYKTAALLLVLIFVFSPFTARKAEAQWVDWANLVPNTLSAVNSWGIWAKEYILDAAAYAAINLVIERITASTVNWINSGFEGRPAYILDPESYFLEIGNQVAGQYIFSNPNLNLLCGPINARVRLALTETYLRDNIVWRCTLTDVVNNIDDFMGDFSQGGWDGFFELTQRQQNNPIGAYIQAENELYLRIASRQGAKQSELNWGSGFLSQKQCPEDAPKICVEVAADGSCLKEDCAESDKETITPGSVIENKLNDVLNIGDNRIAAADEINEIISALITQLTKRIVGGIGSGLRGLSSSDSSGTTFTSELSNTSKDKEIEDYFTEADQNLNDAIYLGENPPDFTFCLDNPNDPYCTDGPTGSTGGGGGGGAVSGGYATEAQNCTWMYASDLQALLNAGLPLTTLVNCSPSCANNGTSCVIPGATIEYCDPADPVCAAAAYKIRPLDSSCIGTPQDLLITAAQTQYTTNNPYGLSMELLILNMTCGTGPTP